MSTSSFVVIDDGRLRNSINVLIHTRRTASSMHEIVDAIRAALRRSALTQLSEEITSSRIVCAKARSNVRSKLTYEAEDLDLLPYFSSGVRSMVKERTIREMNGMMGIPMSRCNAWFQGT